MSMETPKYLGVVSHPAIGIRIPEVFLEGILSAFKRANTAGGLMLSFGRETAPEYVINSPPGKYEITMGHTGTSIRQYLTLGAERAKEEGVLVEMEADHLTVTTSSARAVKRISGIKEVIEVKEEDIEKAFEYIRSEVKEAVSTGYVNFFTLDTCELIDYSVDKASEEEVERRFYETYGRKGDNMLDRYINRRYVFIGSSGRSFRISMPKTRVMRLALKYGKSLEAIVKLYEMLKEMVSWDFGIEVALDEMPDITRPDELLFYLRELWEMRVPVDYVAPNVGFEKKQDYRGDLQILRDRVERLSAVAKAFGAILSFHSGSGSDPYSGKGPGIYELLREATGDSIKYKVSGIYYELLMYILASYPKETPQRELYEEIYDSVIEYLNREVESQGPLDSPVLRKQLKEYHERIMKGGDRYDPKADVFRYYSFIALNLRNEEGRRKFREKIVNIYESDEDFKRIVDREVEGLTLRLIDGLGFFGNIEKIS
ncbi:MAG: hypothetical protein DRJ41_01260 [Thermoprotei archaeon]|nr:MAG: hypothetical protein DRJ41_01260 [Thermoprotei archaeon]